MPDELHTLFSASTDTPTLIAHLEALIATNKETPHHRMHSHHALRFFERPTSPQRRASRRRSGSTTSSRTTARRPRPPWRRSSCSTRPPRGHPSRRASPHRRRTSSVHPSLSTTRALSSSATGASCSTGAPRTSRRSRTSAPSLRRLEHAAELHCLGGDQGASTAPSGYCARCRSHPPSSASWRRGGVHGQRRPGARAGLWTNATATASSRPGFDAKSLPPRLMFIDRSRVVFKCFWLCLLPSQRRRAYLRGELTEGRSFHFGSLSLALECP